jgi:hypothetical protein
LTGIDPGQLDRIRWIPIQRLAAAAGAGSAGLQRRAAADGGGFNGAARDRAGVLDFTHGLHREVAREAANSTGVARSAKTRRGRAARRGEVVRRRNYGELDSATWSLRMQTNSTGGNLTSKRNPEQLHDDRKATTARDSDGDARVSAGSAQEQRRRLGFWLT